MIINRSKALDKITRWSRGRFQIVNTSQRIDRMGVTNDCKHPFPCITPWAQKRKSQQVQKLKLHHGGGCPFIWPGPTWIRRPHGTFFISHRQRFLSGFSAAQGVGSSSHSSDHVCTNLPSVRLGSPHDDGASRRHSSFPCSQQPRD